MESIDLHKVAVPPTGKATPRSAQLRLPRLYRHGGKRLLDLALVLLSAPLVLPLVLTMAILVARKGGKPFYRQMRVGKNGRQFTLWKIRTMVEHADEKLAEYLDQNPEARSEWDDKQKLDHDPRITAVGHLLRKTSMDELPQFWNVLRGDMSLVGPRPMMPEQQTQYPGSDYYDLRPGVTGNWQVSARNESSFSDRAWFDTVYAGGLSLRQDLQLLAATIQVVLRATGR